MTHQDQSNARDELVQMLAKHGFDGMREAIEILKSVARRGDCPVSSVIVSRFIIMTYIY